MYILTAKLDEKSQKLLNSLRKEHFPAHLNYLDAHLTLFHQFPVFDFCDPFFKDHLPKQKIEVVFDQVYFTGKGFAIEVQSSELSSIRTKLKTEVFQKLSVQDATDRRLHVTVSNKANPELAKKQFSEFQKDWSSFRGEIHGIEVWKYLNGPWAFVRGYPFK